MLAVVRNDDIDAFVVLLREHNRQRDKTRSEKLREEIVSIDPDQAFRRLKKDRRAKSVVQVETIALESERPRAAISKARAPFLAAVLRILEELRSFWPLSDRQIHYQLLNNPPLIHASKPHSRYRNDLRSYKALTDLLTRGRVSYEIRMEAIADETRPVVTWDVFEDPRQFVRRELNKFCRRYYRDLLQSQANHFELVGEKNTLKTILEPVAADFTVPLTISRGFCSLPPRAAIADRFELSGKDKLVLICVTDFDPEGERIPHALARSLRDDFSIDDVELIKATLTAEQVQDLNLPPQTLAKESSVNYRRFVAEYGKNTYEVEALRPDKLQEIVRATIESAIDRDAFDAEIAAEKEDARFVQGLRTTVMETLKEMDIDAIDEEDLDDWDD
jgi:hypothetical protein